MQTNLLGTLLGFKAAMLVMAGQDKGGHIFNMDGAGSNGMVHCSSLSPQIIHKWKFCVEQQENRNSNESLLPPRPLPSLFFFSLYCFPRQPPTLQFTAQRRQLCHNSWNPLWRKQREQRCAFGLLLSLLFFSFVSVHKCSLTITNSSPRWAFTHYLLGWFSQICF